MLKSTLGLLFPTVTDPQGREWHVKQAPQPAPKGAEGPPEVVLSRVLSAVGYHQPPVYFVGWSDAFRAGGYEPMAADRFIGRLHQKIAEGRRLGETVSFPVPPLPLPRPVGVRP